jgi:hypothetical protein
MALRTSSGNPRSTATLSVRVSVLDALACWLLRPESPSSGQECSPEESATRKAPRNGAPECGIVPQPHRDFGIVAGGDLLREAQREERVAVLAEAYTPAGARVAVDGRHGGETGRLAEPGAGGKHELQLCAADAAPEAISASTSVMMKRSAPRASRLPGRLSSWWMSMPNAVQAPLPGLSLTV